MDRIEIIAGANGEKTTVQAFAGRTETVCSRVTGASPHSEAFPKILYAEVSEK